MSEAIQSSMEVLKLQSSAPTMPEMPEFADPFEAMLWVIYVQMPAALDIKEHHLGSLSTSLSNMSGYQNELTEVQEMFNEFYNSDSWGSEQRKLFANDLLSKLSSLIQKVESEDFIEAGLKASILDSLNRFHSEASAADDAGQYFYDLWKLSPMGDEDTLEKSNDARDALRGRLNDLDVAQAGFKSSSSQMQALYQYDTEDYKSWVGLTKKIMAEFFDQIGAPIRESLNATK